MTYRKVCLVCAIAFATLAFLLPPRIAFSGGDKDKPKEMAKKPPTHKVEAKPFRIELTVKGVLEPAEAMPIAYRPEPMTNVPYSPGPQTIRTIAGHGAAVAKGEVLVAFDTRRIDQVISQMEVDFKVTTAAIQLAEREQPLLEKSAPLELQAAERGKREADEDLDYFLKTGRETQEKRAKQMARMMAFNYEFAKDQLRQLEKMYKSNDLTEETEQIILRRQRFQTEESLLDMKQAEIDRDHILNTVTPRKEKTLRDSVEKQKIALAKARETGDLALAQKKASLMKMRYDADKFQNNLAVLQRERQAMTMTAPAAGTVYHGKFSQGQWESSPALAARLVPGGNVMPEEAFLTVVKPRPLVVRLLIDEKDAYLVTPGLAGKIETVFNPEVKCPAKVAKTALLPALPGKFEALVNVEIGAGQSAWMPGMACAVKFVPYARKDALGVPAATVFEEDDKHFVYVVDKQGKETKRDVVPGKTSGGRTEILSGLSAGEEILLERPSGEKTPPADAPKK